MQTLFDRYPKATLGIIVCACLIVLSAGLEFIAHKFLGLGNVIVYEVSPIYGYRPQANQILSRGHHHVQINNLGLRAEEDWDPNIKHNKVLFLGDSVTYGGSYIDNKQLFSYLAVKPFAEFYAGNAGVNAWGVLNVHALVKETKFLPADTVVSMFPEGDFVRGLMRIGGQPFWTHKPRYGLEELMQYGVYKVNLRKMSSISAQPQGEARDITYKIATRALKELDTYIKANNARHIIYITPTLNQVLGSENIDSQLLSMFAQEDIEVNYILDKLPQNLSEQSIKKLFVDNIHLSESGHALWADLIRQDLSNIIG